MGDVASTQARKPNNESASSRVRTAAMVKSPRKGLSAYP
jgi:hypothetical protein